LQGWDVQTAKNWLYEIYPQWFERQAETINKLNDLKAKYELMKIEGPQTIEDMYFMYTMDREKLYEQNLGSLLTEALSPNALLGIKTVKPDEVQATDAASQLVFERGLWNSRKRTMKMFEDWMSAAQGGSTVTAENAFPAGYRPDMLSANQATTFRKIQPEATRGVNNTRRTIEQATYTGLIAENRRDTYPNFRGAYGAAADLTTLRNTITTNRYKGTRDTGMLPTSGVYV